jgi:hypothetical protein
MKARRLLIRAIVAGITTTSVSFFVEAPGRDFAAAVANAIRDAEREGAPVRRVERA